MQQGYNDHATKEKFTLAPMKHILYRSCFHGFNLHTSPQFYHKTTPKSAPLLKKKVSNPAPASLKLLFFAVDIEQTQFVWVNKGQVRSRTCSERPVGPACTHLDKHHRCTNEVRLPIYANQAAGVYLTSPTRRKTRCNFIIMQGDGKQKYYY